MAVQYTKNVLISRIRKHLNDGYANQSFPISTNEVLLYIDAAIPAAIKMQMVENAKITGVLDLPDAYLVTYNVSPISFDSVKREWYATLPQTPLALPKGYDITDAYFADASFGQSQSLIFVKSKAKSYRNNLPKRAGVYARIENDTIRMEASDGSSLLGLNLYVQMPISRTADVNDVMNMPDDTIQIVFNVVVQNILQRYGIPYDQIKDNLPSGNKSS